MRLTGPEYKELADALSDAHVDYDDLGQMLRLTGWRIQDVAPRGPISTVVGAIIERAETRDKLDELVAAARAANPDNAQLLKVSAAIGLEPGGVPRDDLTDDHALPAVTAHFERMVESDRGIADFGSFAVKIQELLRQVCAIELGSEFGTGFLIGPQTVLTNYHVIEEAINKPGSAKARLRFDYLRLRDGVTKNEGVTCELADDWLVDAEKYSDADGKAYDEDHPPAEHELDYAVLRTKDKVGLTPSSGPGGLERRWVEPLAEAYDFPVDSFLMVVQHPCHDPIAFDDVENAVMRVNPNRTRVHYRINTMPGSSGSPVLNRKLDVVALHHAGEPGSPDKWLPCHMQVTPAQYNEGIPIDRIQKHVTDRGHGWVFGSEAP